MREHIARLAQRATHHGFLQRACGGGAVGMDDFHAVVTAIHGRAHQVAKTGIHQNKVFTALHLGGAHFAHQHAGLGHQITPGLQLQRHGVAQQLGDLLAGCVPQRKIMRGVDGWLARLVGNGQATTRRNGLQIHALGLDGFDQGHHGTADFLQMAVIHTRTNVHVHADQVQAIGADPGQGLRQIGVPDAVFAVLATGIGLVAVTVAKTGVDAQPHRVAGLNRAQLVQHVDGAAVDGNVQLHHTRQRRTVQQVGSEHDFGMTHAVNRVQARGVARGQRPLNLAQ